MKIPLKWSQILDESLNLQVGGSCISEISFVLFVVVCLPLLFLLNYMLCIISVTPLLAPYVAPFFAFILIVLMSIICTGFELIGILGALLLIKRTLKN